MALPNDSARVRPAPRWVAPLFALLGALTIPWTVYLGYTLPDHARTHNYREAWVGFDIMLVVMLLLTAYLAWRGRRSVALVAASTATMLLLDAWFDVLTSRREEMAASIASAALAELPLAVLCGWIALHADRVAERRLHQLTRRVARLQSPPTTPAAGDGGLVPGAAPASAVAASGAVDGAAVDGAVAANAAAEAGAAAVRAAQTGNAVIGVAEQTAEVAARAAEQQTQAAEQHHADQGSRAE